MKFYVWVLHKWSTLTFSIVTIVYGLVLRMRPELIESFKSCEIVNTDVGVFETNVPTKAVLFSKPIGAPTYEMTVEERVNDYSEKHYFDLSESKEYYIGAINKYNQSSIRAIDI